MIRPRGKRQYKQVTHEQAVEIIRAYHEGGESQSSIARRYGNSQTAVFQIVHGQVHHAAFDEVFPGLREKGSDAS